MDGIHDMGGMHGFGRVHVEPNELTFHASWERRIVGMVYQVVGRGWTNVDAFRHAIERIEPVRYLSVGYYGRWLAALETVLVEAGILVPGEVDRRLRGRRRKVAARDTPPAPRYPDNALGVIRTIPEPPRFAVGDGVRARNLHPVGHTRLPGYVRGKHGVVACVRPACVLPDTHAHGLGEKPEHVYSVRFSATELWGPDAEEHASVHVDLFESYLERP
jgi:nitrile hydratase